MNLDCKSFGDGNSGKLFSLKISFIAPWPILPWDAVLPLISPAKLEAKLNVLKVITPSLYTIETLLFVGFESEFV